MNGLLSTHTTAKCLCTTGKRSGNKDSMSIIASSNTHSRIQNNMNKSRSCVGFGAVGVVVEMNEHHALAPEVHQSGWQSLRRLHRNEMVIPAASMRHAGHHKRGVYCAHHATKNPVVGGFGEAMPLNYPRLTWASPRGAARRRALGRVLQPATPRGPAHRASGGPRSPARTP